MITRTMTALGFAAALALGGAAQAQTTMPNNAGAAQPAGQAQSGQMQKASKQDQQFLKEAMQTDMAEMKMGELAQQKGQGDDVKQFGQMLQQDHQQNLDKAQQLAQQYGVQAPTGPNSMQKQMYDKVSKMSGNKFDKQFARDMVAGHKKAIAMFQKEAKGKGPFAQFAQEGVPVLQKHLRTAQSIVDKGAAVGQKAGAK